MISDYVYHSKYARPDESYEDTIARMMSLHPSLTDGERTKITELLNNKVISSSQRALQFGGLPILEKNARLYNCCVSFCDRPEFFSQLFYLLLCGSGVGFSVQRHHVAQLDWWIGEGEVEYIIQDTIEGWADAVLVLMLHYFMNGPRPIFSYDLIRPRALRHGGEIDGPSSLRTALDRADSVLHTAALSAIPITPLDCFDIAMHLADAVLSGGIRRSATIAVFSIDDHDMMTCKTGDWFTENPQRARANISAMVTPSTTYEEFSALFQSTKEFGEPGFIFSKSTEYINNPCVSGDTLVMTSEGQIPIKDLAPSSIKVDPRFGKGTTLPATAGFATGAKQLYQLSTKEGYGVECTADHEIMTQRGWVEAQDLVEGDLIHVYSGDSAFGKLGTYDQGLTLGWLLGDGTIPAKGDKGRLYFYGDALPFYPACEYKEYVQDGRTYVDFPLSYISEFLQPDPRTANKRDLALSVFRGSEEFLRGFIAGLYGADGTVASGKKGASIRLTQNHLPLLSNVQRILLQFGIKSTIYKERYPQREVLMPDGKGSKKLYECKATHDLHVSSSAIELFPFIHCPAKQSKVEAIRAGRKRKPNKQKFTARFASLTPTRFDTVYDLTQADTSSFIANGLVVHNCVEITMCPLLITDDKGNTVSNYTLNLVDPAQRSSWEEEGYKFYSGFQMCNLTTINASKPKSEKEWQDAVRCATILGTYQASFTHFPYLGSVTERIVKRESLLGVSMTGIMTQLDAIDFKTLAELAVATNKEYAARLNIPQASRVTCVKPEGTASLVLDTSAGIHPYHARKYIRRVQAKPWEECYRRYE